MRSRSLSHILFLPALLAASATPPAWAQVTTGALVINITDRNTHKPLPEATVVLSSPALFKDRVYKSDTRGQIRANLLPVGNYTALVNQSGFLSVKVSDFRVGLGTNVAQNIDMASLSGKPGVVIVTTIAASCDVDGGIDIDPEADN